MEGNPAPTEPALPNLINAVSILTSKSTSKPYCRGDRPGRPLFRRPPIKKFCKIFRAKYILIPKRKISIT